MSKNEKQTRSIALQHPDFEVKAWDRTVATLA